MLTLTIQNNLQRNPHKILMRMDLLSPCFVGSPVTVRVGDLHQQPSVPPPAPVPNNDNSSIYSAASSWNKALNTSQATMLHILLSYLH